MGTSYRAVEVRIRAQLFIYMRFIDIVLLFVASKWTGR